MTMFVHQMAEKAKAMSTEFKAMALILLVFDGNLTSSRPDWERIEIEAES